MFAHANIGSRYLLPTGRIAVVTDLGQNGDVSMQYVEGDLVALTWKNFSMMARDVEKL